jgi:hypothetical protein
MVHILDANKHKHFVGKHLLLHDEEQLVAGVSFIKADSLFSSSVIIGSDISLKLKLRSL